MTKTKKGWLSLTAGFCLVLAGTLLYPGRAYAALANPVQITSVDYEEENIEVKNNGNTKIYFATETETAKGNWEVIEADSGDTTTIDISWLSPTSDMILKFKGNLDETQARVIVNERTAKFSVTINYTRLSTLGKSDTIGPLLNIMTTEGTAADPITFDDLEWKKGDNGKWKDISELTVAQLEKYQIMGTNLHFRIAAVKDDWNGSVSADGSKGRRPSDVSKVKIAKKATPMVVGIDGGKFTAAIKYGKEYRVTVDTEGDGFDNNTTTKWVQVIDKTTKTIPLSVIDPTSDTNANGETKPFYPMLIEIRDYATSKAAASKITEILLNAQRPLGGTIVQGEPASTSTSADKNVYVSYSGTKNMIITVPAAASDNLYEYYIVKPGGALDIEKANWTTIAKNTAVKVASSRALEGGTLYVRMKEIKSVAATKTRAAVAYELASTYDSCKISYPSIPDVEDKSFTYIKGYAGTNSVSFTITLNTAGRSPYETEIKNIKLGSREIGFTSTSDLPTAGPIDNTKVYVMTVTLDDSSLMTMTNCTNKLLSINFMNGTLDKSSIKLTITNPTAAGTLTATVGKGAAIGTTKITLVNTLGTGNHWAYKIGATEVKTQNTQDIIEGATAFSSGDSIPVTAGTYLMLYELTADNHPVKYKCIPISADMISTTP